MKILLVSMPFEKSKTMTGEKFTMNESTAYSLGLGYLHSYLESKGHKVVTRSMNYYEVQDAIAEIDMQFAMGDAPDIVGLNTLTFNRMSSFKLIEHLHEKYPRVKIVMGGIHATICYDQILQKYPYIVIIRGEGELTFAELADEWRKPNPDLKNICGIAINEYGNVVLTSPRMLIEDLDTLPFPNHAYFQSNAKRNAANMMTSRGCEARCLSGDTLIDTTNGKFKIKDLVGQQPLVLTRDPVTKECLYSRASIVAKTGENEQLLHITFKEGGHIDCTPDHQFIIFKNGNQSCSTREFVTEASNLKHGDSVRAIHYTLQHGKYIVIAWGRNAHALQHQLVMEAILKRKLTAKEQIHHIDHNPTNNIEKNLLLTNSADHFKHHPEISQRMKEDNPAYNLPHDFFVELGKLQRGKVRSMESRINYRNSKMGEKNPNYKHGNRSGVYSRVPETNHVVQSVELLQNKEDTYCMEVPGYDWFYANDVLVHNCSFCCLNPTAGTVVRFRSVKNSVDEIEYIYKTFPNVKTIQFCDDTFTLRPGRVIEICDEIVRRGIKLKFICQARAKPCTREMALAMDRAGFYMVTVGMETGDPEVLKRTHKNFTHADILHMYECFEGTGVTLYMLEIVGLPGETWQSIENSGKFIQKTLHLQYTYFPFPNIAMVFPGTELYRNMKKAGFLTDEYWMTDNITPPYTVDHSYEELLKMHEELSTWVSCDQIFKSWKAFRRQWHLIPTIYLYKLRHFWIPRYLWGEEEW